MERYSMSVNRKTQKFKDMVSVLPNLIYRFSVISVPAIYFETFKLILKFIWRGKRPRITNTILKGKVPNWRFCTSRFIIKL